MLSVILPRASVSASRIGEILSTDVAIKDSKETREFDEDKYGEVEVKNQISFDLSPKKESIVEEKIRKLNQLEMTPLDALNTIFELKRDLDK